MDLVPNRSSDPGAGFGVSKTTKSQDKAGHKKTNKPVLQLMAVEIGSDVAALFNELKEVKGKYTLQDFIKDILSEGVNIFKDIRLKEIAEDIKLYDEEFALDGKMDLRFFNSILIKKKDLIWRALKRNLAIPDFQSFIKILELLYSVVRFNNSGQILILPPQMAENKDDWWAVACFSIDGQKIEYGHSNLPLILQAINKVWLYGLALELLGQEKVHHYVGVEYAKCYPPEVSLNKEGKPHNAFSYAGCLVICSLLICIAFKNLTMAQKFEKYLTYMKSLSGKKKLYFNNTLLLLERDRSYQMRAITYFLKANNCFPKGCDVEQLLEFYYQTSAIEVTCEELALMGATIANDGVNPMSNKQVFTREHNKCLLSVMQMCGAYNYSEEFFLKVGLPVKSSKSGQILLIIPGQLSCALYSPACDGQEISVRSNEFCRGLAMEYCAHPYDHETYIKFKASMDTSARLLGKGKKMTTVDRLSGRKTLVRSPTEEKKDLCTICCSLFTAAARGDITMIAKLTEMGYKLCTQDYMQRTILHVAASRGYLDLVRYVLLKCPSIVDWKDCMGCTASENANYFGHTEVYEVLDDWESVKKLTAEGRNHTIN